VQRATAAPAAAGAVVEASGVWVLPPPPAVVRLLVFMLRAAAGALRTGLAERVRDRGAPPWQRTPLTDPYVCTES